MTNYLLIFVTYAVAKFTHESSQVHISLSDEETSIVVQWAVNFVPFVTSVKYYENGDSNATMLYSQAKCTSFRNSNEDFFSRVLHTCKSKLENLKYNTLYDYLIGSDALGWSKTYTFRSKRLGKSANFIVYGDFGTGEQTTDTINSIQSYMGHEEFDGVVHVGDIAYDLNSKDGFVGDEFLKSIEPISSAMPYMVTQGNHESKKVEHHYRIRFTMPGTSHNSWYSFNYGKAHFLVITQEPLFSGNYENDEERIERQMKFIWEDLATLDRTAYPWLIVFTHRPFYCSLKISNPKSPFYSEELVQGKLKHRNNIDDCTIAAGINRKRFEKIWYEAKVDLVITGHVHLYERIVPTYKNEIKGCKVSADNYCQGANAPNYIVTGVPGNSESYSFGSGQRIPSSVYQTSRLSFGKLSIVDENYLRWEQISSDTREVLDYLDLYK